MGENDMITRIAAELVKAECKRRFKWEPSEMELVPMVPAYLSTAYAIVRVMREPTDPMLRAGTDEIYAEQKLEDARECWRAMVDAVLAA